MQWWIGEVCKSFMMNVRAVAVTVDCDDDGRNWRRGDRKHPRV
jgi:hypothetical protein